MNEYNYNQPPVFTYGADHNLLIKTFGWMSIGLLMTAATSFLLYSTGFFLTLMMMMPLLPILLAVAQVALVIGFTASMNKATASAMKVMFVLYSITLGISLTSLAYVYDFGTISVAFLVSALYFACLAFIGVTTKKDLSKFGVLCLAGLIAMIISQLLMTIIGFFIPSVGMMDTRLLSIIGLLLFTGITAWDMQRVKQMSQGMLDAAMKEKMSIYFALQLYLDFINIFLYILRLLGSRNN